MARFITMRTLAGYNEDWPVHAIYLTKLLARMEDKQRLVKKLTNPQTWGKEGERMKFDAIVGNPPYQLMDGGSGRGMSAVPLYHKFVDMAKQINPAYISMITPSRWFAGGKGLDYFRADMLSDQRLSKIVDYANSADCFPGINIAGGVNYFLWEQKHKGDCSITSIRGIHRSEMKRPLNEYEVLIRNNSSVQLIRRIVQCADEKMDTYVYSRNVFGITSDEHGTDTPTTPNDYMLINSQKGNELTVSYINADKVQKNYDVIDKYKVIIGKVVPRNGEVGVDPSVGYRAITTVHVLQPGTVFTETYLLLSTFNTQAEAENFARYMTCKLPRFLLHETYSSMNITKSNFRFVPYLDYSKEWTDEDLFSRYECSEEEIENITSLIRPLEFVMH